MAIEGNIGWTEGQIAKLKALPQDEPLNMINLIRLREVAQYPAGHALHGSGISGREAYQRYGREAAAPFARVGGKQVWVGQPRLVAIGPEDEYWDIAFIAAYPDFRAFIAMMKDPEYQLAVVNRAAGVLDSRLIRCKPLPVGAGFGESE